MKTLIRVLRAIAGFIDPDVSKVWARFAGEVVETKAKFYPNGNGITLDFRKITLKPAGKDWGFISNPNGCHNCMNLVNKCGSYGRCSLGGTGEAAPWMEETEICEKWRPVQ